MRIELPHKWVPREYQNRLWDYLSSGGKRAVVVWPRRHGKDDVMLNHIACAAHERVGNYWHCAPVYAQCRKAFWDAVNPHTGRKRIDMAFPEELRAATNSQEMKITFKNGSTVQFVGSDAFDTLVGSTPVGIVFSEYSLANPNAWAFMRPILLENNGWAAFVSTPRGKNHFYDICKLAESSGDWFFELLTNDDSGLFSEKEMQEELREMIAQYGESYGRALWEQEYYCSFEASLPGAIYGEELAWMQQNGRICAVVHDAGYPVHTAWDLGFSDETAIWFWQIVSNELRLIDYHESSFKSVEFYADLLSRYKKEKKYVYGTHWLPHDARPRTLASGGKSILQQMMDFDVGRCAIAPRLDIEEGIQATRATLKQCWIDENACSVGIEHLKQYRRSWDDEKKIFSSSPVHDQHSHGSDAVRVLSLVWRREKVKQAETPFLDKLHAGNVVNLNYGQLRERHFKRMRLVRAGESE